MIHVPNDKGDFLLGLSLAELIMMLFFVLALLLIMTQQTSGDEQQQCGVEIRTLVEQNEILVSQLEHLKEEISYSETLDSEISCSSRLLTLKRQITDEQKKHSEVTIKLRRLDNENARLTKLVNASNETSNEIEELTAKNVNLEETINQLSLALEKATAELSETNGISAIDKLTQQLADSEQENQACLGRIVEQRKRCGSDWPSCWAPVNGRTHFLLNVKINNEGYEIEPGWASGTTEKPMDIDGVTALVNNQISSSEFRRHAGKVLNWSKERRCRHYVRVYDTNDTSKEMYKNRLNTLENYFYKFEPDR